MEEKINIWNKDIDFVTESFYSNFRLYDIDKLNWKTNSDTWSIAQIIDHLIVTNKSYFPIIEELEKGEFKLPITAKFPFLIDYFGNLILKTVSPENVKKTRTFIVWQPAKSMISKDILQQFSKHQAELKERIKSSNKLIKQKVIISSPANRYIVYYLDKAFDIIIAHEFRHLKQAIKLKNLLENIFVREK